VTEVNGRKPEIGQRILVGSQLAQISAYDELADRIGYDIVDGRGINIISAHISNTPFEILDAPVGQHGRLAADLDSALTDELSKVNTIAAPVDPSTPAADEPSE
jgi:hypothetical protein